jgi:hypothetical protein
MKQILLVLAVAMAIGLGVSVASAATTCHPVLTPGENLARVAANCPPSTTFTIKDGTYKLTTAVNANSGDTFKGVYSDPNPPANTRQPGVDGLQRRGYQGGDHQRPQH